MSASSSSPPAATRSSAAASLSSLLPILNAFNHRHHNQHRLAHWWPVFRILRRTVRNLIDDLTPSSSSSSSLSSRPARRENPSPAPPRAVWLDKHFIPRAYIAFTQLAADNQHAPLGILLLTIISRIHAVLSQLLVDNLKIPPTPAKPRPSNGSEDATNQDKGVAIARQELLPPPPPPPPMNNTPQSIERLQTTTQRPTPKHQISKLDQSGIKPSQTISKEASSKEKKKKKKGKEDALSSLFGSLS
ncbi:hypothetical protein V8C37DRAFT_385876 [Trichoderma ceciliae]